MSNLAVYAKAYVAAASAALGLMAGLAADGWTTTEIITVVLTATAAGAAVWAVPNRDPSGEHQDESVQPPAAGGGL